VFYVVISTVADCVRQCCWSTNFQTCCCCTVVDDSVLLVVIGRCIENGGVRETICCCLYELGLYPGTSSRTHFSAGAHSPVIDEYRSMLKVCACKSFLKVAQTRYE
jgi:hypothetical protein